MLLILALVAPEAALAEKHKCPCPPAKHHGKVRPKSHARVADPGPQAVAYKRVAFTGLEGSAIWDALMKAGATKLRDVHGPSCLLGGMDPSGRYAMLTAQQAWLPNGSAVYLFQRGYSNDATDEIRDEVVALSHDLVPVFVRSLGLDWKTNRSIGAAWASVEASGFYVKDFAIGHSWARVVGRLHPDGTSTATLLCQPSRSALSPEDQAYLAVLGNTLPPVQMMQLSRTFSGRNRRDGKYTAEAKTARAKRDWATLYTVARRWTKEAPDNGDGWLTLGDAAFHKGQYTQAIKAYDQGHQYKTGGGHTWKNLGYSHGKHGQFDKAAASYKKAIGVDPMDAESLYNLGVANAWMQKWDQLKAIHSRLQQLDVVLAGKFYQELVRPKGL